MQNFTDLKECIKFINKMRLENKNNWMILQFSFNDNLVQIKSYNTLIQIFNYKGIKFNSVYDLSVTDFKKELENYLTYKGV